MALSTLYLSHFPLAPQGLRGKNVAGKNVASFHPTNKSCHWVPHAAAAAHSKAAANEQPRMVPCLSSLPGFFLCFTVDSTRGMLWALSRAWIGDGPGLAAGRSKRGSGAIWLLISSPPTPWGTTLIQSHLIGRPSHDRLWSKRPGQIQVSS